MAQNKTTAAKAKQAAKPAKPAVAKTSKPTQKPTSSKLVATTVAKKVNGATATIKKPLPVGKPTSVQAQTAKNQPSKTLAKPAVKPIAPKVDMPNSAAKKAEAPKPAATKPAAAAKPVLKPVAPVVTKPVAAAKPAAPAAKPAVAPVTRTVAPAAAQPVAKAAAPIAAPVAPAATIEKKAVSSRHGFKTNEWIVYPAHGVGRIVAIDEQEIAGMSLELFVIVFEKDKLTLRVPTRKAEQVGMRKLAEDGEVKRAMETLKGKARIKRTMWSRRAQEFEAKINSGNLTSIAEVVRDLYRAENQPEQSYSERQLYEAALDRMAREIAAVEKIDERTAAQRVVDVLSKSAKGRKAAGEAAAAAVDGDDDDAVKAA